MTLPDGTVVTADDGPRAGVTLDAVSALQPVFRPDGTVTAGNCCPLNDGAARVIARSAPVPGPCPRTTRPDVARRMGADLVIDRREQDFVDVVKAATDGRGADVIYDPVGGDTYGRSTKCIAFEGRILVVGFAGGQIQTAAMNHSLVKNYSILGLHWGLYHTYDPTAVRECHAELGRLVTSGLVRPLVSERLRLDRMAEGLQRLADGRAVGRVVYDAEVAS